MDDEDQRMVFVAAFVIGECDIGGGGKMQRMIEQVRVVLDTAPPELQSRRQCDQRCCKSS